jgi:metallo-beta-lactamase superfamily protein
VKRVLTVLLVAALGEVPPTGVSAPTMSTLDSYARGHRVVSAALAATDPGRRLETAGGMRLAMKGKSFQRHQGLMPDGPPTQTPIAWTEVFDLKGDRWLWHQVKEIGGGYQFDACLASTPSKSVVVNVKTKEFTPFTPPANNDFPYRPIPAVVLQRALQQRQSLRWRGETVWDGRKHDVVDFAWGASNAFTLFVDSATRMLSKYELLQSDRIEGDEVQEGIYSGSRDVNGIRFPARYVERLGGSVTRDFEISDVSIDPPPSADDVFAAPAGFSEVNRKPHLTQLAERVWLIEDLGGLYFYNVLFAEVDGAVAVFDAPLGSDVSRQVIKQIHETLPGRPIRYLIVSHYHDDHTAGIRPYVSEGTTIVTTRGNQKFLERVAAMRSTLDPEPEDAARKRPEFLFVEGQREIRDSKHSLQIHRVGPMGHVAEMLFVYLPVESIVYQADLYSDFVPVNDSMVWFSAQLRSLRLAPGRIAGVHMHTLPFGRYEEALHAYTSGKRASTRDAERAR